MMNMQPILLVEDSPEDYEATLRALRKIGLENPVFHCSDGEEALDFLHHRGKYTDPASSPRPGIVLLDLNIPGTDGRDVLGEIKNNESLKTIPILILTTSSHSVDVEKCYKAGANSYIQKPMNFKAFLNTIRQIKEYWFEIVILPAGES